MFSFYRRKVGARIVLGYIITLLLMVALSYFALARLDQINTTVGNLTNKLAVERGLAQDIVSQTLLARFYANKYVRTRSQADLDLFNTEFDKLEKLLVQADDLITDSDRQAKLDLIKPAVKAYGDSFHQVSDLISQRQVIESDSINVQGRLAENEFSALKILITGQNDSELFFAFGLAENGFQLMRLHVANYLSTSDESYPLRVDSGYEDAKKGLIRLEAFLNDPDLRKRVSDIRATLDKFHESFQKLRVNNVKLKEIFSGKLETLEPLISDTASQISASVTEDFKAQNESSQTLVSESRVVLAVTTLVAIIIGLVLSMWFSRGITAPLQRVMRTSQQIANVDLQGLTTQLAALAQGDIRLNLSITASALEVTSEDEVGQMAAAFNGIIASLHQAEHAFKDMALYLNKMSATATDVAQGNLNVNVAVQSQADVLGNALAKMVSNLHTAEENLRDHQEHLEELVAERTLQVNQEKQYLEAVVMNNPIAIVFISLDNKVISWNPSAEKLFGYTVDEIVGRNMDDLITNEALRAEAIAYTQQNLEEGVLVHAITQRCRKDRTLIDVEFWGVSVVVEGKRVGAVAIYHDITELQRARQEAETANHTKSAFLATTSHEIRTPMNGIIGMTSLLLDTRLTPEQYDYAETIRTSGESLLTIINDILDFSKIEAGKIEMESQPFDLREAIESALDLVVSKAHEKRLELVYLIDPQTPSSLMGDVTRLRQILLNLLSNAVKFTEEGEILLSVTTDNETTPPPYTLKFSIRDTGIGIPVDRMHRLFQSFSQIDASTTRKYGGTGLGLAISYRLSELMGGKMWVESEIGKGSTFHFTIQADPAPAQVRVFLHSEQPQLRDRRILIVDDNDTNRRVLVAQMRAWGMIPRETGSPREAIDWIRRGDPFDLGLLDMQMPEMDGVMLANEIRQYRDAQTLPVIMLSSLDRRESGTDYVQFAAYLTKPIKQSILYDTLVDTFAGKHMTPLRVREAAPESKFDKQMADRMPLRILVAEDNAVNQKLALQMLRKMGYRADVAGNGLEALQALERQSYDVVLMDIQMPQMDGLEASRRIIQQWSAAERPRIIAMTANAMQGDRELCLAAGMDDYVSKPIQIKELQNSLERWGQRTAVELESLPASVSIPATIDWAVVEELRTLQEDDGADFVKEMIDLYLDNTPQLIHSLHEAIEQSSADALRHAAHTLKGNSNSLGATQMGVLSLDLEKLGRSGTTAGAESLLRELEHEFDRVRQALQLM